MHVQGQTEFQFKLELGLTPEDGTPKDGGYKKAGGLFDNSRGSASPVAVQLELEPGAGVAADISFLSVFPGRR